MEQFSFQRARRADLGGIAARLLKLFAAWGARARSRRHLARLDDRMLRDIGLDRRTVETDSTISFWRWR